MKTEMQDDSTQPPNCFEESCTPTVREVDTVNATAAASTAPTLPFDHPLASPPRTPRSRSPRPTAGKAGTRATPMDLLPDTQLWPDGGTIVIDLDEPMLHPPEKNQDMLTSRLLALQVILYRTSEGLNLARALEIESKAHR